MFEGFIEIISFIRLNQAYTRYLHRVGKIMYIIAGCNGAGKQNRFLDGKRGVFFF